MTEGGTAGYQGSSTRRVLSRAGLDTALHSPVPQVAEFAEAILKRKKEQRFGLVFTFVSIVMIIAATVLGFMGLVNYWVTFTVIIVFIIASFVVPVSRQKPVAPNFASIEQLLAQDCDPYRFAKAYSDLSPLFVYPQDQIVCKINVALGLFLQGNYSTMETYLASIDPYAIPEPVLQSFYDLQAHYFIHTGDIPAIRIVEDNLTNFSRTHPYEVVTRLCDQTLALIDAHRLAREGDASGAYSKLDERNRSITDSGQVTTPYQMIDYHYNRAVIGETVKDYASMITDCMYVIDHGGLLVYVQEASDMILRH